MYTDVNFKTHYSPACSPSLAGIGAIILVVPDIDRVKPKLLPFKVDLGVVIDKLLNELMGVMSRSLDRRLSGSWGSLRVCYAMYSKEKQLIAAIEKDG